MKGQGSIEYMSILAAVFVVFAAVTYSQMIDPARTAARNSEELSQAKIACDKIAGAIDTVYTNTDNSRTTEFVEFPRIQDLEITEDNVQMSILFDENKVWVGSSIKYGFENSIPDPPNGSYTVIVEWNSSKSENMSQVEDEDRIYININPGGG